MLDRVIHNYPIHIQEVSLGQVIKVDNIKIEILGIKNPDIHENYGNNSSIITKFYVNNKSILFLADTGIESGQRLQLNYPNKLKSTYVQVAHHGQRGVDLNLYSIILPAVALWPTADWLYNNDLGNGYNTGDLKTVETRDYLKKINVHENYVAKDGIISIFIW